MGKVGGRKGKEREREGDEWKKGEQRPGRERKEEEKERIGGDGEGKKTERGLRMSQWCKPVK